MHIIRKCIEALRWFSVSCVVGALIPAVALANNVKLSFLYLPVSDYAPFFVAYEKGYFDQYGIKVDLIPKDATAETVPLLASGNVIAGGSSWGAGVFNALNSGVGVTIVSQFARIPEHGRPPVHLMLSQQLANKGDDGSLNVLRGKKIGVLGPGALTVYLAKEALRTAGLDENDYELVHLPMHAFGQAFANQSIDAGVVFEPFATLFEQQQIATPSGYEFPRGIEMGFMVFNTDFINQHEDQVVRFVAAYLRASQELAASGWQDEANQIIIKKYVKLAGVNFDDMGLSQADPMGKINTPSVEEQEKFYQGQGNLIYSGLHGIGEHYRTDIAEKAVKLLKGQE